MEALDAPLALAMTMGWSEIKIIWINNNVKYSDPRGHMKRCIFFLLALCSVIGLSYGRTDINNNDHRRGLVGQYSIVEDHIAIILIIEGLILETLWSDIIVISMTTLGHCYFAIYIFLK